MTEYGSVLTHKQDQEKRTARLCTAAIIEKFAKERAIVLQAINAEQGQTYAQLRNWIEQNKGFVMEGVAARVKELCVILDPLTGKPYARREQKQKPTWKMPKVFVYLNE